MAVLVNDRRGSILIQFLILFPLLVLVGFAAFQMAQLVSVQQTLHWGAYHCARFYALNYLHPEWGDEARLQAKCERFIRATLDQHPQLRDLPFELKISSMDRERVCRDQDARRFTVQVSLRPGDRLRLMSLSANWPWFTQGAPRSAGTVSHRLAAEVVCPQ